MFEATWERWLRLLSCFALAALLTSCASGGPPPELPQSNPALLQQALSEDVERLREKEKIASLVVTIVDQNGPLYEESFGFADTQNSVRATLDTPYRWGSNSKVFVMLALLQLEALGKVDLDAPLTTYLPEFTVGPPPPHHPESKDWSLADITLRSMLTHHSGLPNDYLRGFLSKDPIPLSEFVPAVSTMRAQQAVGVHYSYSNLAYTLLGVVIERVTGQSLHEYMRAAIFEPAGMDRAAFRFTPELKSEVARPYDGKGKELPFYDISSKPAGALVATTREMGLFASALLRGGRGVRARFIDQTLLESSYERQNEDVPLDFHLQQGLAWMIDVAPVERYGRSVQHGGSILSHHTAFVILRDHSLGALVATNSDRGARSVQEIAYKALSAFIAARTGKAPPAPAPPVPVHESPEPDLNLLTDWEGHYSTPFGDVRAVRRKRELRLDVTGRRLTLRPVDEGGMGLWAKFFGIWDVQPNGMKVQRFTLLDVAGREVVVNETPRGRHLMGVKYEPQAASSVWRKRVGHYQLTTRSPAEFHFIRGLEIHEAKEGHLFARLTTDLPVGAVPPSSALRPVDETWAVTEGLGRNKSVWIRFDDAGRLHFAGLVMKRVSEAPGRIDR